MSTNTGRKIIAYWRDAYASPSKGWWVDIGDGDRSVQLDIGIKRNASDAVVVSEIQRTVGLRTGDKITIER